MKRMACACGILIALSCIGTAAKADNDLLSELAKEDQAVRAGKADASSDDERRRKVLELLAAGQVLTPRDKFNAGLILQHTGLVLCDGKLTSLSAENYLLAHFLFKDALASGVSDAAYLTAASIDRYLSFTEGWQMYGTNRIIDQTTGDELLVPIDRTVSDEERARYGVPPLRELLDQWREQERKQERG